MATPQTLATLALALALALGLAGCSPEDTDEPHDPLTSPASPTAEPTEENTDADTEPLGPVKTVRAWVDAYNTLVSDGDATEASALSTEDCDACERLLEPIIETHENGGRYEDPGWEIRDAKRGPEWPDTPEVGTAIRFPSGKVWKSSDAEPIDYPQEDNIITFRLRKDGEAWLVSNIIFH